jgi:hypothetical protein
LFFAKTLSQEDFPMCTDAHKVNLWNSLRQRDLTAFRRWLDGSAIDQAAALAGVALGTGPLHLGTLTWLALAGALHTTKNFAGVLQLVIKLLQDDPQWQTSAFAALQRRGRQQAQRQRRGKHDPRGTDPCVVSEEAFVQARQRMPWGFWVALLVVLTARFEQAHGPRVRFKHFRLLALDGTTINLDHWRRLTDYFGSASRGKGRRQTQARMVMLQLPLVRLPWRYEVTPLAQAEKTVAARLLGEVRSDDLVLMDRGFWSYALFTQIAQRQAFFAIRQIAQAHLPTARRLGPQDRLVRFRPSHWRKAWTEAGWSRDMTLRVIDYQVRGFRPSAVVTNVLDPKQVSAAEWVRLTTCDDAGRVVEPGLYHRRWDIETTFHELKVTQGMQGGLRGRTPAAIRYEIAGHVLLYLLVRWLIVEAAEAADEDDPLRLSFKGALDELQDMRQSLLQSPADHVRRVLLPRLLQRIASHRVPQRPGRHYPRPRDGKAKNKGKGRYQQASKISTAGT